MGILPNKPNSTELKKTTKGFYFGALEAEGEIVSGLNLLNYFDDFLGVLDELEHAKFIFVGRKGSGKSAIAKYIKDKSDESQDSNAVTLRINDLDLEKFIQIPETEKENKEKLLFEWLILINVVKLIVAREGGKYTKEYDKLKKFLDLNSGAVNIDEYQVVEGQKNKGGEIAFGGLRHIFEGVFKNYFGTTVTKAPFYKLIPPLRDIVKILLDFDVNKSHEFWIQFDDLDINFSIKNESHKEKILDLIRIAKYYNTEIFKRNKARVLVFIRDDIRDAILSRTTDSAKGFQSYEIPINWYSDLYYNENQESKIPLKQMADKRIKLNFEKFNIAAGNNPWNTLFKQENYGSDDKPKSSFKFILDFTFYRPRDIITFLNTITKEEYEFPIGRKNLKSILHKYINSNINEIKSELTLVFSEKEIATLFSDFFPYIIDKNRISLEDAKTEISKYGFTMNENQVIDSLLGYSLLTYTNSEGLLYFNYRENLDLDILGKDTLFLTLPKMIYHKYKKIQ